MADDRSFSRPFPIRLFEPTDVVRFAYDEEDGFWFQCPHMATAHRLPLHPEKGWVVQQKDPLSITPSIHVHCSCGSTGSDTSVDHAVDCHGFITNGEWKPC